MFGLDSIKSIVIAVAVAGVLGWAGYKTYQVHSAESTAKQAIIDRDKAVIDRDAALSANAQNVLVIQQLQDEKSKVQDALNNLEKDRKRDQVVINNLSAAIKAGAADPANQVKLSPIIQSTVDNIQKRRNEN